MLNLREKETIYKNCVCYVLTTFLVVFPFCVYIHVEQAKGELSVFANSAGYIIDFFLYYKEMMLIVISILLIIAVVIGKAQYREKSERKGGRFPALLLWGYVVCVLLSTVCSEDKKTVWLGIPGEYEGAVSLIAYMVLFTAGSFFFDTSERKAMFRRGITILCLLIGSLSVIEYCYSPIYEISFMRYIIAPEKYRRIAATLQNQNYQKQTALSFYNPGYLGGICSLLLPVAFGAVLCSDNWKKRLLYSISFAGVLFALISSTSTGPLYAAIFVIFLGIIVAKVSWKENVKGVMCVLSVCAILFSIVNVYCGEELLEKVEQVLLHKNEVNKSENSFQLSKAVLEKGIFRIDFEETSLYIEGDYKTGKVFICDESQNLIAIMEENQQAELGKQYEGITIYYKNRILFLDIGYEDYIYLYNTLDGIQLVGRHGKLYKEVPQPLIRGMEMFYPFLTGRGYAWMQSIPLLKECLVLGKGPGSFVFHFQQEEVVGMMNTHGSYMYLLDKPHNWYLQIWINTGGVSLLCILGIFLLYAKRFWQKRRFEQKWGLESKEQLFSTMGILAFAISGLVNDSIVAVNPIFWLFFGVISGKIVFSSEG